MTLGWAGWSGRRALARNWEERRVNVGCNQRSSILGMDRIFGFIGYVRPDIRYLKGCRILHPAFIEYTMCLTSTKAGYPTSLILDGN